MFKRSVALLTTLLLSSCSYLHVHKQEIIQGTVITPSTVSRLHRGMSEDTVKQIMGEPMLANIFTPNRLEYVYTIQPGGGTRTEKRVTCVFEHGRLVDIQQS